MMPNRSYATIPTSAFGESQGGKGTLLARYTDHVSLLVCHVQCHDGGGTEIHRIEIHPSVEANPQLKTQKNQVKNCRAYVCTYKGSTRTLKNYILILRCGRRQLLDDQQAYETRQNSLCT